VEAGKTKGGILIWLIVDKIDARGGTPVQRSFVMKFNGRFVLKGCLLVTQAPHPKQP
jgi:hypothetical protein